MPAINSIRKSKVFALVAYVLQNMQNLDISRCCLRPWQTRTHCCRHIVAHDVSWAAQAGKHLLRTQNVSEQNQKHFFVPDTKFVSATNVAWSGKRGNICVGNNVSATMCPRLPGPFWQRTAKKCTKIYNARAQPLLCLLNLLFGDVLFAVVVVGYLSSLLCFVHGQGQKMRTKTFNKELCQASVPLY